MDGGDIAQNGLLNLIGFGAVLIIDFVVRVALIFYIPRNRKPTSAMAWLLTIYIMPLFGTILYFIIGNSKLSKERMHKRTIMSGEMQRYAALLQARGDTAPVRSGFHTSAVLAEAFGELPPVRGNTVKIISGYNEIIDNMIASIDAAKSYVYVEFFALALDSTTEPFFAALERAIARKVAVYVLFDTLGSNKYRRYGAMKRRLQNMGAHWHSMLPIRLKPGKYNRPDLRNHRKIVVVDSEVAYLGSLNMIQSSYKRRDSLRYIELTTRMEGPVVGEHAIVFAGDWFAETGVHLHHRTKIPAKRQLRGQVVAQVVPSGPDYEYENNLKLFVDLIHNAKEHIAIVNPYFVPEESLLSAIIAAAKRGVKVTMLNSEVMDQWMVGHAQRSYYEQIMSAGVNIYLYKSPLLLHSKFMTIDNTVSVVGSSNMDVRSFELNLECVSVFYDKSVSKKLHEQYKQYVASSVHVTPNEWKKRGFFRGLLDGIARLTSALQ